MSATSFSKNKAPRRWLIVGSGSIARRHVDCITSLLPGCVFSRLSSSGQPPTDTQIDIQMSRVHQSWDEALRWMPDAAVVANAAIAHVEAAEKLLGAGIPVLLEKPLATDGANARRLIDQARTKNAPILVGYCLRFHRAIEYLSEVVKSGRLGEILQCVAHVGQHIDDWRPPRTGPVVSIERRLGGGALLELSHEIDLALAYLGRPVAVDASLSFVDKWDVEAAVGLLLSYRNAAASITLNMLERPASRTLRLVGSQGSISVNLISGEVVENLEGSETFLISLPDNGQMYMAQMAHFLRCVSGLEVPRVSLSDAAEVIACIELAHQRARKGDR